MEIFLKKTPLVKIWKYFKKNTKSTPLVDEEVWTSHDGNLRFWRDWGLKKTDCLDCWYNNRNKSYDESYGDGYDDDVDDDDVD